MSTHFTFEWSEELPDGCPPDKAKIPNNEVFFRLISRFPPSIEDFFSQRKLHPNKMLGEDECIARAISLQKTARTCENLKKFPVFKNSVVARIVLDNTSGVILRTSRKHYSWWMSLNFNPIDRCELV